MMVVVVLAWEWWVGCVSLEVVGGVCVSLGMVGGVHVSLGVVGVC